MAYYKAEVRKYLNLGELDKNDSAENALFYYSLFNSKMYEDETIITPKTEEIKQKVKSHLDLVGSNEKDSNTIIEEIFSPEKDIVTCLLLARRLRQKRFEVEPNFNYGELEIDLFNEHDKVAIEIKRVYSTNNFCKETLETSDKYNKKRLENKVFLLFLLPCQDDAHIETINRATRGFKTVIKEYKQEKRIIPRLDTFVCGFSEHSSVNELSEKILGMINLKSEEDNK